MAMDQLGKVLNHIIAILADAQTQQKELWRLIVSNEDTWNFCYAIPNADPNTNLD